MDYGSASIGKLEQIEAAAKSQTIQAHASQMTDATRLGKIWKVTRNKGRTRPKQIIRISVILAAGSHRHQMFKCGEIQELLSKPKPKKHARRKLPKQQLQLQAASPRTVPESRERRPAITATGQRQSQFIDAEGTSRR